MPIFEQGLLPYSVAFEFMSVGYPFDGRQPKSVSKNGIGVTEVEQCEEIE